MQRDGQLKAITMLCCAGLGPVYGSCVSHQQEPGSCLHQAAGGGGWSLVFIAPRTKVCTKHEPRHPQCSPLNKCKYAGYHTPWNNGKSGAKLVLTSSTTPGLQIHKFDHSRTANPCDWLLCRRATLPLVGCPHSIVYLHLPVVKGLIFCISAIPHLGTSFPLFHDTGHLAWLGNAKHCRKLTLVLTSYPQLFVSRQFL